MAVNFSDAVKKYGSTTAAFQALGYTKNENGAWTKSGSSSNATNAPSTGSSGGGSGGGNSGGGSGGGNSGGSTRVLNEYGFVSDPSYDYSREIDAAKARGEDTSQLEAERANKIKYQYGGVEPNMYGSNQTYTQLSGAASGGNKGAQNAINNAIQFSANNGSQYMGDNAIYKAAYEAAAAGDWDKAAALANQLATQKTLGDGTQVSDLAETNRYLGQLQKLFNYNANDYYQQKYDAVYGAGAWDGGTGTGKPTYNDYSKALVDYYNQNNGQQMVTSDQLNLILGGGASSSGGPGGSGAPNLSPIGPAGNAGSLINGSGTSANVGNAYNPGSMGDYLDQWLSSAQQQQVNKIDYGTNQAVLDLIRQQQDAQGQFQEQRNQIAIDEAKAKDNQALYAEARGDKGGIGQAQYDQIMATAAQNRLAVNQAQTKLATDTARQIADLRAQGEYEKADALLQLSQQYLSQLINLEQWSMEFGLSVAQFNASLDQWKAEYEMKVADLTGYYNGMPTLQYQQYQDELAMAKQSQDAALAESLLAAGVMPSPTQLAALGMTREQAQSYITAAQLAAAKKSSGGGSGGGPGSGDGTSGNSWADVVAWVNTYGEDAAEDYIKEHYKDLGYSSQSAALSGWNNYLLSSERQANIDDMNAQRDYHDFKQMAQAISAQLQSGKADSIKVAQQNTAAIWNGLTEAERQSLRDLYARFGYQLNVN